MRYIKQFIVFIILAVAIILNSSTSNAAKKTSGKDAYGNDWSYDAETKTLTFTGEGKAGAGFIMDDRYLIGCGMDSEEKYRHYPGIAVLGNK